VVESWRGIAPQHSWLQRTRCDLNGAEWENPGVFQHCASELLQEKYRKWELFIHDPLLREAPGVPIQLLEQQLQNVVMSPARIIT